VSDEHQFDGEKFGKDLKERIHQRIHDGIGGGAAERRLRGRRTPGMWPGIVLVLFGTVILLDHMGVIYSDRLWRYWPALLIAAGVVRFLEACNRAFSVLLILVGGLLLLGNLGYVRLTWSEVWPIILIGAGLALIWSRFEMPKLPPMSSGGPNTINEFAMFGGVERRVSTSNFQGGSASAMFGGVELDFRSAEIEGEEAVLFVEAIFGGIEIVVPERWMVVYEGHSIFGGYGDETRPPLPDVPGGPPKKRLVLRGRAVFGGISVKN
jgi:predicted membrane protein